MSRKKLIITSAILAVVVLIGGLLAYFTDTTETRSNVFTVGDKVDIRLNETWNEKDGQGIATGETKTKAPKIENIGGNDAYVFMKVSVPKYYDKTADSGNGAWVEAFSYSVNSGWSQVASNTATANGTSTASVYVYAYAAAADSGTMTTLAKKTTPAGEKGPETTALFDSVTFLPGKTKSYDFTAVNSYSATPTVSEVKNSMNIDITGYAIQTTGLTKTTDATQDATTAQDIYACLAQELSLTL